MIVEESPRVDQTVILVDGHLYLVSAVLLAECTSDGPVCVVCS